MARHAFKVWNFPGDEIPDGANTDVPIDFIKIAVLQDIRDLGQQQLHTLQQINAKLDAVLQGDGATLKQRRRGWGFWGDRS